MNQLLIEEFNRHLKNNRVPIRATLQLTYTCNYRCIHCYQTPIKEERFRELTVREWTQILTKLREQGCIYLTLTGGEIFMYKDFESIYLEAYKMGFRISLITNGSLINDKYISLLTDYKPNIIHITLYGSTDRTYRKFTSTSVKVNSIKQIIMKLKENNVKVNIQVIANTINKDEIDSLRRFSQNNNIPFLLFSRIRCFLDGDSLPKNLQLSPKELVSIQSFQENERLKNMFIKPSGIWENGIKICNAGLTNVLINPEGNMILCNEMDRYKYSLVTNSFEYCWHKIGELRTKYIEVQTYCSICDNREVCGLCAPVFSNEYKDTNKSPANECEYTKQLEKLLFDENGDNNNV